MKVAFGSIKNQEKMDFQASIKELNSLNNFYSISKFNDCKGVISGEFTNCKKAYEDEEEEIGRASCRERV